MAEHLAGLHQTTPDRVEFREGWCRSRGEEMTWDARRRVELPRAVSLTSTGFYATPDLEWDRIAASGKPFFYFAYGCAVTEVVIDTLTGENRILRADVLHDCGRLAEPALDIGQIEGGYVQGAGWLTDRGVGLGRQGAACAPMRRRPTRFPPVTTAPRCSTSRSGTRRTRAETIYRSKAVGEPPLMLGISAFLALRTPAPPAGRTGPTSRPGHARAGARAVKRARG
jgi:xanthine dehydrogenase large subunit